MTRASSTAWQTKMSRVFQRFCDPKEMKSVPCQLLKMLWCRPGQQARWVFPNYQDPSLGGLLWESPHHHLLPKECFSPHLLPRTESKEESSDPPLWPCFATNNPNGSTSRKQTAVPEEAFLEQQILIQNKNVHLKHHHLFSNI